MDLISIIVVTYNSSKFIIENLESIYDQTWRDIELILTDDNSIDNTVEIVRDWLEQKTDRFVRVKIIVSKVNTGVSGNANRGLKASRGKWIKFIAGDDTLKPGCIEDNINWVRSKEHIKVLFSKVELYKNVFEQEALISIIPDSPYNPKSIMAPDRSAESQYKMLLISDRINFTPSFFICRDTMMYVGGYDERFRLLEDYPLWLKLTKNGYRLNFMDKITVRYRMHDQAINNKVSTYVINPNYFKQEQFRKLYIYSNLPTGIMLAKRFEWYVSQIFRFEWLNKQNRFNKFIYSLLTTYLNPFIYFIWIKKRIVINLKHNEFYS